MKGAAMKKFLMGTMLVFLAVAMISLSGCGKKEAACCGTCGGGKADVEEAAEGAAAEAEAVVEEAVEEAETAAE